MGSEMCIRDRMKIYEMQLTTILSIKPLMKIYEMELTTILSIKPLMKIYGMQLTSILLIKPLFKPNKKPSQALSKIRHYHSLFFSHIIYASQIGTKQYHLILLG